MSAYSDLILAESSLIAYWRLGDSSGNAIDDKGSLDLTVIGATYSSTGIPSEYGTNTSVSFDGVNDRADRAFTATLNPSGSYSVECWILCTGGQGTARRPIASSIEVASQKGYSFFINNQNYINFIVGRAGSMEGDANSSLLVLNKWTHLVGVFDSTSGQTGTTKFYVDGVLVRTSGSITHIVNDTYSFAIGVLDELDSQWFPGKVDEVAIYGSALSAGTVLSHYNAGHGAIIVAGQAYRESSTTQYQASPVLRDSGSALYAVWQEGLKVRVFKADSRAAPTAFTEQDSANNKTVTNNGYPFCHWLAPNGDLHIGVFTGATAMTHYRFDTDTDLWTTGFGAAGALASAAVNYRPARMVARSDNDVIVGYTSNVDDADITSAIWEGASWAVTSAGFLAASSVNGATIADMGIDSTDRAWIAFYDVEDLDLTYRSLNSAGTLTGEIDVETSAASAATAHSAGGRFNMYDDGGTEKVIMAYINSGAALDERIASLEADAASGQLATEAAVQSTAANVGARTPIGTGAVSGVPYAAWWDEADNGTIWLASKSGGTWTPAAFRSGVGMLVEIAAVAGGLMMVTQAGTTQLLFDWIVDPPAPPKAFPFPLRTNRNNVLLRR